VFHFRDDAIGHGAGREQEQRGCAFRDLFPGLPDEVVVDADIGERAPKCPGCRPECKPKQGHEEDEAEEQPRGCTLWMTCDGLHHEPPTAEASIA
jgi:hypothetical protein